MGEGATLIGKRHPRYATWLPRWSFFEQSYLGGDDYIKSHLFKYFKEGDKEFTDRCARAYRENHTKRVVDLINTYLFKEDAVRKIENAKIAAFRDNFDGMGKTASQFMKGVALWASVFGRIYIIVDKESLPEKEQTNTQADNLKAKVYCYIIHPDNMLDISFDGDGKVIWALVREYIREKADDPYNASGDYKEQYRLWEAGKWTLFNDAGNEIESGDTGLNLCPIVIVDNEEQEELSGQSLVGDIAYIDRAIFNNWSRLDTIVCDQTFSQLIFPIEGLPADIINDENLRKQFLTLATNRVILYSAQAQAAPQYISPDAGQATFILTMLTTQTKQLYASLGLQSETGTEAPQAASGVAKAYDFDKLNKLLASKADNLEKAEKEVYEIFQKWTQITGEVMIDYPEKFDVKSLLDEIAQAEQLAALNISNKFMEEINKIIVQKALPKVEQKTLDEIFKEIKANSKEKEEASQNLPFAAQNNNKFPKGNKQQFQDEEEAA